MAYKMEYTPQEQYRYPSVNQKAKSGSLRIYVLLSALMIAVYVACKGVPDFLIPGDPAVTKLAVQEMISLMKTGTGAYDAITVFCKQIINGATF